MKDKITKILFPNKILSFFIFNGGFGLLIYVFSMHLEETPLAYISYILSFYALVIFCIWFYKTCKFQNNKLKKSKIYVLYQENFLKVTTISMLFSFLIHFIYGIFELMIGIFYESSWFITLAIYYLLLCFMKLSLMKDMKKEEKGYLKLKQTGKRLLFLNFIFIGIIILIIKQDQVINYHGFSIYLVALYDFYLIIQAFINVIKYRKKNSPILIASKCINFTVAMISMVSLEVAMVCQFGQNDSNFKFLMTSLMGLGISFINFFMGVYMIRYAKKNMSS